MSESVSHGPFHEIVLVREVHHPLPKPICTAVDVADFLRPLTEGMFREQFYSIPLNTHLQPLGLFTVSVGSVDSAPVHPREALLPCLLTAATAFVVAHNHPSGDPTPSISDRGVTDRLKQAGQLVGIEMLDHLVIGETSFYSFAEERTITYGRP